MLDKLAGSALTEADARKMQVKPCTAEEAKRLKLAAAAACFLIPYFDLRGKPTRFYRARYLEDTRKGFDKVAGKKALRYTQPPDTSTELYLYPNGSWTSLAVDPATAVIITEGELKAACCTQHGLPCIGLGGVWSFQSNKHGQPLIPGFDSFLWEGRTVYIVYDSDAVTNPDVVLAESRLAQRLLERGAIVFIGRIPPDEQMSKVGIDDFIVLNGFDAFSEKVLAPSFEYKASEVLHGLNQRVVYVRDPGFIWDHETRQKVPPGAFKEHAFSNHHITEQRTVAEKQVMVKKPAAKAWLEWEYRAEVKGLTFQPGAARITEETQLLNTWSGWGVDMPRAGDVEPWEQLMGHLFGSDLYARRWFEQWCAYPLQHPGYKMVTAAAIWGTVHGSGKSLVGYTLMRIYGVHAEELKDDDLDDERKQWAQDLQFVLADDITARGDRRFMRRLMTMVTQKFMRIDPKYVPSYKVPDCMNWYFTSNDPDALYMDDEDRRFFIHETNAGKFKNYPVYKKWMDSDEGISALWYYFLNYPMDGFDPSAEAPETLGKASMIELGKSDLGAWVRELRDNGVAMLSKAGMKGDLFTSKELHALYDPGGQKKASPNALARELKRAGFKAPGNGSKLHLSDGQQVYAYAVINRNYWREASWKLACSHYEAHRPPVDKRAKKKF